MRVHRIARRVAQRWASSALPSGQDVPQWDPGLGTSGFHTLREGPGQPEPATKRLPGSDPKENSIYDVEFADDLLKHHDRGVVDMTDWSHFTVAPSTVTIPRDVRR